MACFYNSSYEIRIRTACVISVLPYCARRSADCESTPKASRRAAASAIVHFPRMFRLPQAVRHGRNAQIAASSPGGWARVRARPFLVYRDSNRYNVPVRSLEWRRAPSQRITFDCVSAHEQAAATTVEGIRENTPRPSEVATSRSPTCVQQKLLHSP